MTTTVITFILFVASVAAASIDPAVVTPPTSSASPAGGENDGLADVSFQAEVLPFNDRDPTLRRVPTTVPGGAMLWRGGFAVNFSGVDKSGPFDGWSSVIGSHDGKELWVLSDAYARLLRVSVEYDPVDASLARVASIKSGTWMADAAGMAESSVIGKGSEGDGELVKYDMEAIASVYEGNSGGTTAGSSILDDFVVSVEQSRALARNNLLRFRRGQDGMWEEEDLPGAREAFAVCHNNSGPESLLYLPPVATSGSGFTGAALLSFCEKPVSDGAVTSDTALSGFIFDVHTNASLIQDVATDASGDALVGNVSLARLNKDCGLSDATVTPDGVHALLLYHCYTADPSGVYERGLQRTEIRVAPTSQLRVPGATVIPRLLVSFSSAEGCTLQNMEGIFAFVDSADPAGPAGFSLVLVSDDDLGVNGRTQIVKFRVVGDVYADDVADAAAAEVALARKRVSRPEETVDWVAWVLSKLQMAGFVLVVAVQIGIVASYRMHRSSCAVACADIEAAPLLSSTNNEGERLRGDRLYGLAQ